MRNALASVFGLLVILTACSESIKVKTRDMEETYVIIEGRITDRDTGSENYVYLSQSVPYFENKSKPDGISGAEDVVSDGEGGETVFTENPEGSGHYFAPDGFKAVSGRTYSLDIRANTLGSLRRYHAEALMPELGFEVDKIDYTYNGNTDAKLDSLWTVLMWGKDDPDIRNIYLAYLSVNGHRSPLSASLMIEDKYFNGKNIEKFPVGVLNQTAENRKQYGECSKFLEEGDVITLDGYVLTTEYYRFISNLYGDSGLSSLPLISSQPVNPPTNISGDGKFLGFFAACPTAQASVTVTDPFKDIYQDDSI